MASLGRGRQGASAAIWPGFLDLMTSLVMVLMFVLTVFMIVQFALRDTINTQGDQPERAVGRPCRQSGA
jgi:chemotaxis protein MotB